MNWTDKLGMLSFKLGIQVTNVPKQGVPLMLLQDVSRTEGVGWN